MTNFTDPNEMPKEMLFFTYEEFKKFISVENDILYKTMFETLYYCGLRRGEARGLQWTDINWNEHTLSITKQANSVKDHQHDYELTPPKTKKSIRTLPFIPSVVWMILPISYRLRWRSSSRI